MVFSKNYTIFIPAKIKRKSFKRKTNRLLQDLNLIRIFILLRLFVFFISDEKHHLTAKRKYNLCQLCLHNIIVSFSRKKLMKISVPFFLPIATFFSYFNTQSKYLRGFRGNIFFYG